MLSSHILSRVNHFCAATVLNQIRNLSSQPQGFLVERLGNVVTICLNNEESKNKLNINHLEKLSKIFKDVDDDETCTSVVMFGIGGNFCSGFEETEVPYPDDLLKDFTSPLLKNKISVAAINGYTLSLGLELALLFDFRVVEETAILGFNARKDFNFSKPCPKTYENLVWMLGLSKALDVLLVGENFNGTQAVELGIVNRLVACGTALGQAINLAKCVSKFSHDKLIQDRNSLYSACQFETKINSTSYGHNINLVAAKH